MDDLEEVLAGLRNKPTGLIPKRPRVELPFEELPPAHGIKKVNERGEVEVTRPKPVVPNPRHCEIASAAGEEVKPSGKKKRKRRCSENSRLRRRSIEHEKFLKKVREKRDSEVRARTGVGSISTNAQLPRVPQNLKEKYAHCAMEVAQFYNDHPDRNRWLELSEGPNVSNPDGIAGGGKGVFARCDVKKGTFLCPYLGEIKDCRCEGGECLYDMRIRRKMFVCAREILYDVGYLYQDPLWIERPSCAGDILRSNRRYATKERDVACPPNYGRYVNSLTREQRDAGKSFICRFELLEHTRRKEIFLQATRDIKAGEEILAYYGNEYALP